MLYLQYVNENNIESIFENNIAGTLEIKFQIVISLLEDRYKGFTDEENKDFPLRQYFEVMKKILSRFDFTLMKTDIFVVIYINLLYELLVYCRTAEFDGQQSINNKENLVNYISNMINELSILIIRIQFKKQYSNNNIITTILK